MADAAGSDRPGEATGPENPTNCQNTTSDYSFQLYVAGSGPKSRRAIKNIKDICEKYLSASYDLKVIDLYQRPDLAEEEDIIAVPTLVKSAPEPARRIVGDLSDTQRVLDGLGVCNT